MTKKCTIYHEVMPFIAKSKKSQPYPLPPITPGTGWFLCHFLYHTILCVVGGGGGEQKANRFSHYGKGAIRTKVLYKGTNKGAIRRRLINNVTSYEQFYPVAW
jgi:hypothetical protein